MRLRQLLQTRLLAVALALTAVGIASACSYDELKAAFTIEVHGIPGTASQLLVVVNDSSGGVTNRNPSFGPGSFTDLEVSLPAPSATGVVTINVTALDRDQNLLAGGTFTGNFLSAGLSVDAPLTVQPGTPGTFGATCGTNGYCGSGLTCKRLGTDATGICTRDCPPACDAQPAGATCQPFNSTTGQGVCQWECDQPDGGRAACPVGLSCGSAIAGAGGKKFCQASP